MQAQVRMIASRKIPRWLAVTAITMVMVAGFAFVMRGTDSWRPRALLVKAKGGDHTWLRDVSWPELLRIVRPGSGFSIEWNWPELTVRNPFDSAGDITRAQELFQQGCAPCHGAEARGTPTAPRLSGVQLLRAYDDLPTYRVIRDGIKGTSMPPHDLPWADAWRLSAYVQSIKSEGTASAQARLGITVNVSAAELADSSKHPENWLTYSGTYDGRRFSGLKQLSRANAARLQVRWIHQLDGEFTRQQTVPLVYKGIMFFTSPPARLSAVDAASGKLLWRYEYRVPSDIVSCCGNVNRGAAILGNQVFFATIDAHLIALDAETGKVNWQREVADHRLDFSITSAPLAVNDLIVTGIAGGEFATRGFLAAFRASDGEPVWRFETVPGPGMPGNETWEGNSWKNGGSPTWMTGSFDPVTNTLYWGVGNPAPQLAGDLRRGDNLYSCSVVALDAGSGALRWHFQFTPHDTHDWDSAQVPVLVDEPAPGRRKLLSWANRNGFFYSLDAATGKFLRGRPFAKQTWADGLDANGRPIVKPGTEPSEQGTLVLPSSKGATNWWPPAYDPVTNLLFVPTIEVPTVYFSDRTEKPRIGSFYKGGTEKDSEDGLFAVRALDALSGEMVWEQPGTGRPHDIGGLLATAGGLVFGSIDGLLRAMDTRTGQVLWSFDTGAENVAPPVTYLANGEQFVVVAAGKLVLAFSVPTGPADTAAGTASSAGGGSR